MNLMTEMPTRLAAAPATSPALALAAAPELSVIIPTFKERANVPLLVKRLEAALAGVAWEAIFVDDNSPDGTAAAVREIGARDARVRCIRRIGRRGLAGACVEGMLASQARYVAVIDADLQHDETQLATMLDRLRRGDVNLVIASRHLAGGSDAAFSRGRAFISHSSNNVVRRFLGVDVSDPMSGFFALERDLIEDLAPSLSSQGFKLLVDILATGRGRLRVAEVPYVFRDRLHGDSKLDSRVALDFVALLIAKLTHDAVSLRFLMFCLVGLTGVFVHMFALAVAVDLAGFGFQAAQTAATLLAVGWNFTLNNRLTYRDQRLTGWRYLTGLARFILVCSVGAISNVGAASWLYETSEANLWVAGLSGAVMGAVWNYAVSAAFVWRQR